MFLATTPPAEGGTTTPTDVTGIAKWIEDNQDLIVQFAGKAVLFLAVLIIGWIVAGILGRMTFKAISKAKVEETLGRFLSKLVRWLVLIMVLMGCLGIFGINVASFAAILAAAGFAVGMAFQGTLSNFAAGVMLLVFRPFKVGDVVNVAGQTGKITEIDLFTTNMDTPDNRRIILPNSSILGATIENITFHDVRRVDVGVGTDYSADLDATRAVLEDAARAVSGQVADRDFAVVLGDLGDSCIGWTVRIWVPAGDFWPKKEELTRAIKTKLDAANIGIPFPQMDIHVDKLDAA